MKRITTLLFALFVSVAINAQTKTQANEIKNRIENSLPSSLPNIFSGVKICVDPGHGGHNSGNDRYIHWLDRYIGINDYGLAYWESNGNFYTALYMREVLEELGAVVKLTREMNDNDITSGAYGNGGAIGSSDPRLSYRENISNTFGAKYFQSIHTNATGAVGGDATPNTINYVRSYVPNSNSAPQTALATKMANIHKTMNYSDDTKAQVHSFSVTNNVSALAVLTEGGFHTQVAEARRLRSPMYLQAQAMAWIKSFVAQEGKMNLITWGEIGGITYSDEASEYTVGPTAKGYELGLGLNKVKVTLDKGTANEKSVTVDQDELDANYNEGEHISGGNHVTENGGYNGYYYFNFVSPGSHTLTFEKSGISTKVQTVTVVASKHLRNDVKLNVVGSAASAPVLTLVSPSGADGVFAQWKANTESDLVGYRLFYATDDSKSTWRLAADESTISKTATLITIASKASFIDATSNTPKHFKLVAVTVSEGSTIIGDESNVLSKFNGTINNKVLIVEGFDRRNGGYTLAGTNFILKYINAIADAKSLNISSTLNENIISGDVSLGNYDFIVWVLGDESSTSSTLAWNERSIVDDYLMGGGNLFISGANLGWDLVEKGDAADQSFYANYLKATYTSDGTAQTSVSGATGTFMDGITLSINDTYTAGDSDEISNNGGSILVMKYPNGNGAGVFFKGMFASGTAEGSLMHLSFGLEASTTTKMTSVFVKYFDELGVSGGGDTTPCTLSATSSDDYFVRYVKIVEGPWNARVSLLENITDANGGYANFKSISLDAVAGNTYSIMGRGKLYIDNSVNPSYWKVWIDFNQDDKFDGTNEEVVSKQDDAFAYNDFTIPGNIADGSYTLRIVTSSQPITSACGIITAGEIEDYTININDGINLALGDIEEFIVNAYPNPVMDALNIRVNTKVGNITVYSTNGMVMYEEEISSETIQINSSDWTPGIYIIVVDYNSGREVLKVLKR